MISKAVEDMMSRIQHLSREAIVQAAVAKGE